MALDLQKDGRLCILTSRFPERSETFIFREATELVKLGYNLIIQPIVRRNPLDIMSGEEPEILSGRVMDVPEIFSAETLLGFIGYLFKKPITLAAVALKLAGCGWGRPGGLPLLAKSMVIFLRAMGLGKRLRDQNVRHIHSHFASHPATAAWILKRIEGIPFSIAVHAHDIYTSSSLLLKEKSISAEFIVANNNFNLNFMKDKGFKPLVFIYNGLNLDAHRFSPERPNDGLFRMAAMGRMVSSKGFHVLLEAITLFDSPTGKIKLTIYGDGPDRQRLEGMVAGHGLHSIVELKGWAAPETIRKALHESHILIAPSVIMEGESHDGLPNIIMEGMAAGTAVIATDVAGIPEAVINEETGLLVPPGNAESLSKAIQRMINETELRKKMVRQARAFIEDKFDAKKNVARLGKLFEKTRGLDHLSCFKEK